MPIRVLVCGGRDYNNAVYLWCILNKIHREKTIDCIIQGGARGADLLAKDWAQKHNVPQEEFLADWKMHNRAAGPIRNKRMLIEGKPDLVVAFPGGRGTAHMIKIAQNAGVPVYIVKEKLTTTSH